MFNIEMLLELMLTLLDRMLNARVFVDIACEVWNMCMRVALLSVFFLLGFSKDTMDLKNFSLQSISMIFFKYAICVFVMLSVIDWMPKLFSMAKALLQTIIKDNYIELSPDMIYDSFGEGFIPLAPLFGIVLMALAFTCGITIIITVYSRLIKIFQIIPLAPVALSTLAGGRGLSNTGYAWIKTFLRYTFEIIIIGLAIYISSALIGPGVIHKYVGNNFFIATYLGTKYIDAILSMILITSSVKGSDMVMKEALGL